MTGANNHEDGGIEPHNDGDVNKQISLQRIRSKPSLISSFVRFVNETCRSIDIIWLNYEGARVKYRTLRSRSFVDVNTYVGHPWIFRDSETGDRLVVHLKEVYHPAAFTRDENGHWPMQRKVVNITIPVYSLKERCLQVLRYIVPYQAIDTLNLPNTLKQDMKMTNRMSYCDRPQRQAAQQ